jgi:general stress protein CsbA
MPVRPSENRRIHSLLRQRTVSDVVMVAILSVAFLAGLIGFAVHVLWIVSVVVLALGLGYVVANARQDRREAIDRHREDEEARSR